MYIYTLGQNKSRHNISYNNSEKLGILLSTLSKHEDISNSSVYACHFVVIIVTTPNRWRVTENLLARPGVWSTLWKFTLIYLVIMQNLVVVTACVYVGGPKNLGDAGLRAL